MTRIAVPYTHSLPDVLAALRNPGLLLAATRPTGESNAMIIGWGSVGVLWGRPAWTVMVRPSRYTYEFIEESGVFTVNVPPAQGLEEFVRVCGTQSGRDVDKFGLFQVAASMGETVPAVTIDACPLVYECRVLHHVDLVPTHLDPAVDARAYPQGDYHRFYHAEITGVFANA